MTTRGRPSTERLAELDRINRQRRLTAQESDEVYRLVRNEQSYAARLLGKLREGASSGLR